MIYVRKIIFALIILAAFAVAMDLLPILGFGNNESLIINSSNGPTAVYSTGVVNMLYFAIKSVLLIVFIIAYFVLGKKIDKNQ